MKILRNEETKSKHASGVSRALRVQAEALRAQAQALDAVAEDLESDVEPVVATRTRLLTTLELAAELRLARDTIDRLAKTGAVPFVLVGSRKRFDPAAVRASLESAKSKPKNDTAPVLLQRKKKANAG